MKNLKFVQLHKGSNEHYGLLESLMIPYNRELAGRCGRAVSDKLIMEITRGMLNMQGEDGRHLEICYDEDKLIGFMQGKVDRVGYKGFIKPGYGYIMEFYVKPEFRLSGYGKAVYKRLKRLFLLHGVKRMYLTASEMGESFREAAGLERTGEISLENGLPVREKDAAGSKDIITVTVDKYLTNELAVKIALAQWHTDKPEWVNSIRERIYCDNDLCDCFCVTAVNQNEEVVGRLYCIQNEQDKSLWYYGDLFVIPEYRRIGVARRMINAALKHLADMDAKALRCYTEPENKPSISFQKSCGFQEKPYEKFNDLINDGQIMFQLELPCAYSAMPASENEARFIAWFYTQNIDILHGARISVNEWKEMLTSRETDEKNFLICRGCVPVAWLKINGLHNQDAAWISMLAVSAGHQRRGAGKFAVDYAEEYIRSRGFAKIRVSTTEDNIPAQMLYKKCGYTTIELCERLTGDGVKRMSHIFEKILIK